MGSESRVTTSMQMQDSRELWLVKALGQDIIKLAILSHTMLGRQVTYNSIIFISVDYYMQ